MIILPAESSISFWPPAVASDEGPTPLSVATTATTDAGATMTLTIVEWVNVPLVPATVTVKLLGFWEATVRVDVADPPRARKTL